MAEIVFQNLESMLPELEDLERSGVFSKEEIRAIIKRRTDFEYKLQKRVMEKQDLLNYLEYERKLDLLRGKRAKRLKVKKYSTAAISFIKRIHDVYQKALMKFGNDLQIWLQYIEFCKKSNSNRALSKGLARLLRVHSNNPDVWIIAAKFEFEEKGDTDTARALMQKALRANRLCPRLWQEYFRLELMHVEKIKKRRRVLGVDGIEVTASDGSEPVQIKEFLSNATAQIVFRKGCEALPDDIDFRLGFLKICECFDATQNLEDIIYESMLEDFPGQELAYRVLAERSLSALKKKSDRPVGDEDWLQAESRCKEVYAEATSKVPTAKMWEMYAETFASLIKESSSAEQATRRMETTISIFEEAEKCSLISSGMFMSWADLLCGVDMVEEATVCLQRAVKSDIQSFDLWKKLVAARLQAGSTWEAVLADLKEYLGHSSSDHDACQTWELIFDLGMTFEAPNIDQISEDFLNSPQTVVRTVLPKCIKWITQRKGVKSLRKLYRRLRRNSTVSLAALKEFILAEISQVPCDTRRVRSLFLAATTEFGSIDADIWLNWIEFEQACPDGDVRAASDVYLKASRTLQECSLSNFNLKYTLLKTKLDN